VIEPLILQLECQQGFRINNECTVSSLAFADDIILQAAPDVPEARLLIEMTDISRKTKYEKSALKCAAFQI
jgi:hypothetical protein